MSRNSTQPRSWAEMVEAGQQPARRTTGDYLNTLVARAHGGDPEASTGSARLTADEVASRLDGDRQPEPGDEAWHDFRRTILPELARRDDRRGDVPSASTMAGAGDRGRIVHGRRDDHGRLATIVVEKPDGTRTERHLSTPIPDPTTSTIVTSRSDEPGPVVGSRVDPSGDLVLLRRAPGDDVAALPPVEEVVGPAPKAARARRAHRLSGPVSIHQGAAR